MKENWQEAKRSLSVEKQKDFSIQKHHDLQPEKKFEWGRLLSHEAYSAQN